MQLADSAWTKLGAQSIEKLLVFTPLAQELWTNGRKRFSGLQWGLLGGSTTGMGTGTRAKRAGSRTRLSSLKRHQEIGKETEEDDRRGKGYLLRLDKMRGARDMKSSISDDLGLQRGGCPYF